MKKNIILVTLAMVVCMFANLSSFAQGVVVHKKDGTKIDIPYTELDSITTYNASEAEVFSAIAAGIYTFGTGVIDGAPVFKGEKEVVLYQSNKDPNQYVIHPWLNNETGLLLIVNPENNTVSVPVCDTGYEDSTYGVIYATDIAYYTAGQVDSPSTFNPETLGFELSMAYIVEAGYFGLVIDKFTATETAAKGTQKTAKKMKSKTIRLNGLKIYEKKF
jgi:hypothetical protein